MAQSKPCVDNLSKEADFSQLSANQLATVKMLTNIKALKLIDSKSDFSDCTHLGSVSRDQVLVLDSMFKAEHLYKTFEDTSKRALFLNIIPKCAGVKSIDFDHSDPPFDVLLEVARRCPELECIKLNRSRLNKDEWVRILDEVGGEKILHFVKGGHHFLDGLLQTIAAKCNNIKRLDWVVDIKLINFNINLSLTSDMLSAFKMLPKDCYVTLDCGNLDVFAMDDVIDELKLEKMKWSAFDGRRYDRLSSLKFSFAEPSAGPVRGVDFVGIKKFNQQCIDFLSVDYLLASRFPLLEEFGVSVCGVTEEAFDTLFQKMALVKKLTLHFSTLVEGDVDYDQGFVAQLPQAAIHRLKNLETIVIDMWIIADDWQPEDFLKQLEQYVYGISPLKKLTVDTRYCECHEWQATEITNRVEQIKKKQNRVEVEFIKGFYIIPE